MPAQEEFSDGARPSLQGLLAKPLLVPLQVAVHPNEPELAGCVRLHAKRQDAPRSANVERTMVPEATPSATFSETSPDCYRALPRGAGHVGSRPEADGLRVATGHVAAMLAAAVPTN